MSNHSSIPIQFGMPTLIECPTLDQSLELCSELGLDFVELNMNLPEYQLDSISEEDINKILANTGKYLTIHLEENIDVCDFNTAVADAYLNTVLHTIEFAVKSNAPIINMHMADGVYFTLPERKVYLYEHYLERYLDKLCHFRDACDNAIGRSEINICIENCGRYHDFQRRGIDLLLVSSNFALTYDVGHDFLAGKSNEAFILSNADRLMHMHVHDVTGSNAHLPIGDGELDVLEKLSLAQKHGCRCVLETKTVDGLKKSVGFIRAKWQPMTDVNCVSQPTVSYSSSNTEKIDLFMSLFRGRDDVYARRWESKDGQKFGYSPVCRNEWARNVCEKPRVKCTVCKHRELVPFERQVIERHLLGKVVAGIYPLLPDETCCFLVIDFDGDGWKKDVCVARSICERSQIPYAIERSRSGNGAHLWLFFEEPIPAPAARNLGSAILTSAMNERHELNFSSYDRLFPSQDTMPKGGFGNLIALPLQREPRDIGNSVFVDENLIPYPDQWAFLGSIKRMTASDVELFKNVLGKDGELGSLYQSDEEENAEAPWREKIAPIALSSMDFPPEVRIIEANMLYIEKTGVSQRALNRIKRLAAFKNPEFYKAQAMRFPTWDKPRIISISDETERYLCLPRGNKYEISQILESLSVVVTWQNERNSGNPIDVEFNGTLRDEQSVALEKLSAHENGILSATTAFGKTVVSAALIAKYKTNALILVNRQPLLDQWKTRLKEFLIINEVLPEQEKKRGRKKERDVIGQLGGGKNAISGIIDIAVIQSLVRGDEVKDFVKNYGMVIVDECHHVSAVSFERVLREVNAKYVYGLTATPKRQDGHQPIIYMHCGQIRFSDDAKVQAQRRPFEHYVIPRFTSFRVPIEKDDTPMQIQELYNEICQNETRNNLIVDDVLQAVSDRRCPLVLTERKAHVELLESAIRERFPNVITFIGGQSAKSRRLLIEKVENVPPDQPFIIVATGKYVGEGFDVPRLDTLFLAMPFAWQGTLAQYAGRLHRLHDDKQQVQVYDYVDVHVAVLDRMYAKRVKGYSSIGYMTKSDVKIPDTGNIIFDGSSFLPVFSTDLLSAKREVIIVSPYLTKARLTKMMEMLDSVISSGIKLTIATRPTDDYADKDRLRIASLIDLLRNHSANIIERSKIHQKFAVIDGRVSWYGSINLLSFGSSEESIMRLESKGISEELLRSIQ